MNADELPPESNQAPEVRRRRVVSLRKPAPPVHNASVALLERLLDAARKGAVADIGVAWCDADGVPHHEWVEIDFPAGIESALRRAADEISDRYWDEGGA